MRDFLPKPLRWSWHRTAMLLATSGTLAWILSGEQIRVVPVALFCGAVFDGIWYSLDCKKRETSFRVFKTYCLQSAWAANPRFKDTMTVDAFVALFEDCLRNSKWREEVQGALANAGVECRTDPYGDNPGTRGYLKVQFDPAWSNSQKIGVLICLIGSVPTTQTWLIRENNDSVTIETDLYPIGQGGLPRPILEFLRIFVNDLSKLLDLPVVLPTLRHTTGLTVNVDIQIPCVLPLADGSYLHVAENAAGILTAQAEKSGVFGDMLEYENAGALWSVWRHAVVVHKVNDTFVASVPDEVLSPAERLAIRNRTNNG